MPSIHRRAQAHSRPQVLHRSPKSSSNHNLRRRQGDNMLLLGRCFLEVSCYPGRVYESDSKPMQHYGSFPSLKGYET
ncbi:unnamed protein product [Linum tenue]|uniref:Uncharacterized protein n=1 Tax=Linum tenue TaxID=586396 RepID=A0AAV0QLI9_9ROSI|nr:unnamed protein product [Linum tenue]